VVELRITKTDFDASSVNKYGGKLSLKCNYFKGINNEAVSLSEGTLNMSSTSAAGYNTFENTGTCILLNNAQALDLYKGYNNLSGYSDCCICGTVNRSCKATCDLTQNALNNYWGAATNTFPPSPQPVGPLNPSQPQVIIELYTSNGPSYCYINSESGESQGCKIHVTDTEMAVATSCGAGVPVVRPVRSLGITQGHTVVEERENTYSGMAMQLRTDSIDPGNPLINTTQFDNITLDSALVFAALQMELYDSLGNDANAVALFHEVLTSPLDRSNSDVRWRMEWGRYNMKGALENMFLQNELIADSNQTAFELPVWHYVEVLNAMTDTLLTDSTYKEQFYVEIDKGQLLRTIGKPLEARFIYLHLDDCELDSLEQALLNNWIAQVDMELSVAQQYQLEGVSPDSINYGVDTTQYNPPTSQVTSDHYFGVWILSPTSFTFVNCGNNAAYRNLLLADNTINVYPNPSNGLMTISMEEKGIYQMNVLDMAGKIAFAQKLNMEESSNININLSGILAKGNYMLVFESSMGLLFKQIIVE
jgi:hypothetical protein